jgi:hypothetical protein
MPLTNEQKSAYLVILNATMILRSIGKTFKRDKEKLKNFKVKIFTEIQELIDKMEQGQLKEEDIISSIERISNKFNISFGQSQKAINVLLKYHYYMFEKYLNEQVKPALHCPLDSVILNKLGIKQSLTKIDRKEYLNIQQKISEIKSPRINFDREWDIHHLKEEGIL